MINSADTAGYSGFLWIDVGYFNELSHPCTRLTTTTMLLSSGDKAVQY